MKTKTLIAAIAAALSVTITLAACGSSTSSAPRSTAQDPTTTARRQPPHPSHRRTQHRPDSTTTVARLHPPLVDELVPVHGARLHVHCDGAGPNDSGADRRVQQPT